MLHHLNISAVRNLHSVELYPSPTINLIHGPNGSGKTSLLEAIHILGVARSFRTPDIRSVISSGVAEATVFADIVSRSDTDHRQPLGVQKTRDGQHKIRFAGKDIGVSELAGLLPLQIIDSTAFLLLDGSPQVRRQYIDWGTFHFSEHFIHQWRCFNRVLKQRNSLLKCGRIDPANRQVWDAEFIQFGEAITALRSAYIKALEPLFSALMQRFLCEFKCSLEFHAGWDNNYSLAEALEQSYQRDLLRGFSGVGPQRADLRIRANGYQASQRLSRGQKKLVVGALKLAQGMLCDQLTGKQCIFLLDDLPAELDTEHRALFCEVLAQSAGQCFISCIEPEALYPLFQDSRSIIDFELSDGQLVN